MESLNVNGFNAVVMKQKKNKGVYYEQKSTN